MQALLLSGEQLLSPHLSPSSSKGDAGGQREGAQEKPLLSFLFPSFFLQVPVPSYAKAAPALAALGEGECCAGSASHLSRCRDVGCAQQGGCGGSLARSALSA